MLIEFLQDACYGQGGAPHWCSSNTDSGSDDFGCDVHFDIDTDPTQGDVKKLLIPGNCKAKIAETTLDPGYRPRWYDLDQ